MREPWRYPKRTTDWGYFFGSFIIFLVILAKLAFFAWIIYVAHHFIMKVW